MIRLESSGSFKNLRKFLKKMEKRDFFENILDRFGEAGVAALAAATPVDTGKTASSWYYTISNNENNVVISWHNSNLTRDNVPVAILIQYGHGTGGGAYVQGRDFINPAILGTFDAIAISIWNEVRNA